MGCKDRGQGCRRGTYPTDQGATELVLVPMSHCGDLAPLAPGHQSPKLCRCSWLQAVPLESRGAGWEGAYSRGEPRGARRLH